MAGKKQPKAEKKRKAKPVSAAKSPPKTREQKDAEKQALAMWALLGQGGEACGGQLKPKIEKAEREALERTGLIDAKKQKGGAWCLIVTDQGWDWAEHHLADPLPEKTFGGACVLQAWLARLSGYLSARGVRLAEILAVQPESPSIGPSPAPALPDHAELRARIRAAYQDVAGGFNRRVLLRDLRPKLEDMDRPLLDAALMQMLRDEEATLMQIDYRPDVSDEDRAAALQIGNEPRHIIWISK